MGQVVGSKPELVETRKKSSTRAFDRCRAMATEFKEGAVLRLPHPIPYQGSKRLLAQRILDYVSGPVSTLIEPFAGSASFTIAAARAGRADRFLIGDSLAPLVSLWVRMLSDPAGLADEYEALWLGQTQDPAGFYNDVRAQFNAGRDPARLLYLLARCVKNAVRFNPRGEFNQSPDHRRLGMRPEKMRREIGGAYGLLSGRTETYAGDYEAMLARATKRDLVYMDPPYQGTSSGRDKRYVEQLDRARFVRALDRLNAKGVRYIVSFDGRCGDKTYGEALPSSLGLHHIELEAGVSSQATLSGRHEMTIESLYLSPNMPVRRASQLTLKLAADA